ncbi:cytosolic carboxypeptidase 4 [Eucyclogobius newberryi]|uniref:cytosolic carboxypeptidase 4 n=1 Tax=Eucyclogobius newberryi TaxID=166745 RepID=UPI003B5C57AD
MFNYGRSTFTWNGTLKELQGTYHSSVCKEGRRSSMAASPNSSSGLEVLLSTLQNAGDVESTLNILNVLDELLSAGTDRRIHYLISKGGSEALLKALVNTARCFSPNYTILLPLLHLLAKVGHRDRRIGMKAEDAGGVVLTLNLLKQNLENAKRAAACLWVIQVFASSVSTANLIGENCGIDVIFRLIPPYTTKNLHTIKAAINAFGAVLCTKANVCLVVSKGYISGLLRLYEDWHCKDTHHVAIAIRHALLRCLHKVTYSTAGREAFFSLGGLRLIHQTTQACLLNTALSSLVEPSVQLMRKCLPKTQLPLTSNLSAYSFPIPGRPHSDLHVNVAFGDSCEDSDEEEAEKHQETTTTENNSYDDDLETDSNKLRHRPELDRPKEALAQYNVFCPELSHDFQELDLGSEKEKSSASSSSDEDDEELCSSWSPHSPQIKESGSFQRKYSKGAGQSDSPHDFHISSTVLGTSPSVSAMPKDSRGNTSQQQNGNGHNDEQEAGDESCNKTAIDRLLERNASVIPFHDPKLYSSAASKTRSIPDFNILGFPDFWGHLPPQGHEPMAPRKPNVQRQKVLEDVQRFLNKEDIVNKVVFDLEDCGLQCPSESLKFFSKFESGNLRKAVQVRKYEYDLILNADVNSSQNSQWFYFEVSNMEPCVPYRFNIINCEKTNSQFNYGMQPVLYSVREALDGRPHWVRAGTEICYYRNNFCPVRGRKMDTFYTMTFSISFRHSDDVCYLAYHYPYSYSALKAHLKVLQKSIDPADIFFQQQTLCGSLAENPCPLVTITACPASRGWKDLHQLRNRSYIVLTGRVHPGEPNASWVMKGTLEFLCSSDPVAQSLRETYVFKIIPMLNPDGVINGTNRCNLNSEDLNRQWCKPDPVLSPTIFHTKGFLYHLNSIGRTPLVYCDYHGHSRKKNVFLYGCSVKETLWQSSVDTVGVKEDPGYRTIPKTLDRLAPAFSINSCNYLVEKSRSATARVVVWREIGVLRSYTMESTFNGCDQGICKGLQMGTRELQEMGVKFCHSLLSVSKDVKNLYSRRLINHIDLDHNTLDHTSNDCFEDDEPPCVEEIEYSKDCPAQKGADLDSDVNNNMVGSDEDEACEEEHQRNSLSPSHSSSTKSRLITQTSIGTE